MKRRQGLTPPARNNFSRMAGGIATILLTVWANSAQAETNCPPPEPGEYLLLLVTERQEQQELVKRTLPQDTNSAVCRYINDTVTRVAGFRSPQVASEWARYLQTTVGVPTYVASSEAVTAPQSQPANPAPTSGFNPQPLGPGYAVLVDYANRPELATQVQGVVGRPVGLVSYGQRPYLLAAYTADQGAATVALQTLSNQGFITMLVDSRRVTLLSPAVKN